MKKQPRIEVNYYIVDKQRMSFLNKVLFVVGMIMVWKLTHNGWALFWTWVASWDVVLSTRSKLDGKSKS